MSGLHILHRGEWRPSSVQAAVLSELNGGCELISDPCAAPGGTLRLIDEAGRERLLSREDGETVSTGTYWGLRDRAWIGERWRRGTAAAFTLTAGGRAALRLHEERLRLRRREAAR